MKIIFTSLFCILLCGCSASVRGGGEPSKDIEQPFITMQVKF